MEGVVGMSGHRLTRPSAIVPQNPTQQHLENPAPVIPRCHLRLRTRLG